MLIDEDKLISWTKPGFDNEAERAEETKSRVQDAISKHPVLSDLPIKIFTKGSYANNTNVRRDSDIDIAVELTSLINVNYHEGVSDATTGLLTYTGISETEFKGHVCNAVKSAFGTSAVDCSGNKAFKVKGSSKVLDADIVPCTKYLECFISENREGIQLILDRPDGLRHVNFPDQHLNNGVYKNEKTSKRYKRIVRILKNARNMILEKHPQKNYHSFMIESLAYNMADSTYLGSNTWKEIIENFCIKAWQYLKIEEPTSESMRWMEVNDLKFLFHAAQKWTRQDAKEFVIDIYNLKGDTS